MSVAERANARILVVESDIEERANMRHALRTLGFTNVSDSNNHVAALERCGQKQFTHIIFEARRTTMPANIFVEKVMEATPHMVMVAASFEPVADDVFGMLVLGARGYLVKPFTAQHLESAMIYATKGDRLPDEILNARDRNQALAAFVMASLDWAATLLRQSAEFETAKRELPQALDDFRRASDIVKTFAKGGPADLACAIETFCLERGSGPASKLGRLRKRLQTKTAEHRETAP